MGKLKKTEAQQGGERECACVCGMRDSERERVYVREKDRMRLCGREGGREREQLVFKYLSRVQGLEGKEKGKKGKQGRKEEKGKK